MPRTNSDHFTYFIKADFGRGGISWVERSINDADKKTTLADIASGQWGDILQILECNPAENICNDVTEELLAAASALRVEDPSPVDLRAIRWDHERDLRKHEECV